MVKYTSTSGIYLILNVKNNKIYIGQAEDIHVRQIEHFRDLGKKKHHNRHLQNAYNKYGEKSFKFQILEYCTIDKLDEREQHYLDIYIPKGICYNIAKDATAPMRGIKHTEESLEKMRTVQRSIPHIISPEQQKKMTEAAKESNKGREPSLAQRERFRLLNISRTGQKLSEEHRCNIGKGGIGRIPTEETRRKLSESNKGKKRSLETRRKISEKAKGREVSEETKQKLSLQRKGKPKSEAHKLKLSEAAKLRWKRQKENQITTTE